MIISSPSQRKVKSARRLPTCRLARMFSTRSVHHYPHWWVISFLTFSQSFLDRFSKWNRLFMVGCWKQREQSSRSWIRGWKEVPSQHANEIPTKFVDKERYRLISWTILLLAVRLIHTNLDQIQPSTRDRHRIISKLIDRQKWSQKVSTLDRPGQKISNFSSISDFSDQIARVFQVRIFSRSEVSS